MVEYTTKKGIGLRLNRLPRKIIDDFITGNPMPNPPQREVKVWGGDVEYVDDTDSPHYQAELLRYKLKLGYEQTDMLLPAIDVLDDWQNNQEFVDMVQIGVCKPDSKGDFLRYVAMTEDDFRYVVDEIFYMSTVTDRGIEEAKQLFNVTWYKQDIMNLGVKTSGGGFSRFFEEREAARFAGYCWDDYTQLSGKEQSTILVHYKMRLRLDALQIQERNK